MTPPQQALERHKHIPARGIIRNSALGVSDGLVTNLAFLSGLAAGAGPFSDINLVRIAGTASMLAGAISMFFGGFLAGRSEFELFQADVRREKREIEDEPDEEKSELKNYYMNKGLSDKEAQQVVEKIASNEEKFLEDLLIHELHVHETVLESPFKTGGVLGLSYLAGALIPLIPFLFVAKGSIILAALVSALFLFLVGGLRARVVGKKFWKSGLETLTIGLVASVILYLIGTTLSVL